MTFGFWMILDLDLDSDFEDFEDLDVLDVEDLEVVDVELDEDM